MRCYYPYVNYVPSAIPRQDQLGRLKGCTSSGPQQTIQLSLSDVLSVGNSAGIYNILMNGQNIFGATVVETNSLELNDGVNGVSIIQLSGPIMTYLAGANGSSHQFFTKSITGVSSNPVTISSDTTTITNATTINDLSSTTQPNGTNNTTVATTAFVQNAISTLPKFMPYFYGETPTLTNFGQATSIFGLNISNTSSWGTNAYFTISVNFEQTYNLGSSSSPNSYFQSWSFLMDIYPERFINMTTADIYLLNGTLNGSSAYSIIDPTYSPNGRMYWTRTYENNSAPYTTNVVPIPIYITSTSGTSGTFLFNVLPPISPNTNGGWRFSANLEIVNSGNVSGSVISTNGLSTAFSGGSYYSTF
jgi:hypothetical protein